MGRKVDGRWGNSRVNLSSERKSTIERMDMDKSVHYMDKLDRFSLSIPLSFSVLLEVKCSQGEVRSRKFSMSGRALVNGKWRMDVKNARERDLWIIEVNSTSLFTRSRAAGRGRTRKHPWKREVFSIWTKLFTRIDFCSSFVETLSLAQWIRAEEWASMEGSFKECKCKQKTRIILRFKSYF